MEDNINILDLVYRVLEDNDMWFTTKNDPTFEEPSSYYELDEFGDLTEKSQKKIAREVESYIGDGAIDNVDAVNMWLTDAQSSYKVDFKDNLVTKFSPKPVVAGIEAYENSVPLAEAKVKKTEGAGAGYNVEGIINVKSINSFNVISQEGPDNYGDITATVDCDIDITLTEMSASSYYYGNDINVDVPAKVTGLTVKISEDDEQNDIGVDESSIKDLLDGTKFETLIGGGWTHTTFTGDIQATDNDITGSEYYYSYFTEIDIQISDENIIKYIDKVVEGENFYTEFLVYDKDDDVISDGFTAEETDYSAVDKAQNDAIEFAKANKGVRVVKHTYRELADGDLDDNDTEPEVVWERDYDKQYKYDVEENKKVTEASKYVSKYDELNGMIDLLVSTPEEKVDLYNKFNPEAPIEKYDETTEDLYTDWLDTAKTENYDELRAYLEEQQEELDNYADELFGDELDENKQLKETESPFRYKVYGVRKNGELVDGFGGSSLYKNFQEAVIDAKELGADEIVEYGFANEKAYNDKELAEDEKVIWKKKTENFKLGTKDKTLSENYQRRLDEVNNKSKNLISSMFTDNSFDSDSKQGQIVMRTSEMFNALSDKGYDVEVTFDNGESTSAIQLGQQGGKVMITITNTDQPLRAFTAGNIEVTDESIKILQDIQTQIEVL